MRLRHFLPLAALVLAGCATHDLPAPPRQTPEAFFAANNSCTAAGAQDVGFDTLRRDAARFKDTCVRVTAFSEGRTLLRDAADHDSHPLGLIWQTSEIAARLRRAPSFVELTGRLRDCYDADKWATLAHRTETRCDPGRAYAIFVSAYRIIPTAMD